MKKQGSDLVTEADELYFPEGIWSEILSWLKVKYLLRCKSVCKLWFAIINSKQFAGLHATHDGRRSFHSVSFESCNSESINSYGIREKTSYLDLSCKGFILVRRISLPAYYMPSATYRLWNPSTKCVLDLPPHDPYESVCNMTLFQSSCTNSYYALSDEYIGEENKKHSFKLLDLGGQSNDPCPNANLSWKTLNISEYEKLNRQQRYKFSYVQTDGILYILVLLKVGLSNPKIICFDLIKQESCTTLDVPDQSLRFKSKKVRFQLWRGKPAVSFILEEKLNAWVLEDYKQHKWANTIQIPLPVFTEYPNWKKIIPTIHHDKNGEVFFRYWTGNSLWKYDPKIKSLCRDVSPYARVPVTLDSVRGMQLEQKHSGWICGISCYDIVSTIVLVVIYLTLGYFGIDITWMLV